MIAASRSKEQLRGTRVVLGILFASLFVPGPRAAARGPVADPGAPGPYAVGFTSVLAIDTARPPDGAKQPDGTAYIGRPVPLYVWYPADASSVDVTPEADYRLDEVSGLGPPAPSSLFEKYGCGRAYQAPPVSDDAPFPLVLFSPGSGGHPLAFVAFAARLASHGFVVAVPYHWGDAYWSGETKFDGAVAGVHRPGDLSFALTTLLSIADTPGQLLAGAIRPDQVAAAGWSLGGFAAIVLAGGDDLACDTVADAPPSTCVALPPDARFRAILALDALATPLHWWEMARVTVPSLVMGREWSTLAALAAAPGRDFLQTWVARPHGAFSGHPNIRVDVSGTNHQSFSGTCQFMAVLRDLGILPPTPWPRPVCKGVTDLLEVQRLISLYSVSFLRTALVGDPGLDYDLTPGWALTREPLAEVFVTEKRNPNAFEDDCLASGAQDPSPSCPDPHLFLYFPHQPGKEKAFGEKEPAAASFVDADDLQQ